MQILQAYALLAVAGTLGAILVANMGSLLPYKSANARKVIVGGFCAIFFVVWVHPVVVVLLQVVELIESKDPFDFQVLWHLIALIALGLGYALIASALILSPVDEFNIE